MSRHAPDVTSGDAASAGRTGQLRAAAARGGAEMATERPPPAEIVPEITAPCLIQRLTAETATPSCMVSVGKAGRTGNSHTSRWHAPGPIYPTLHPSPTFHNRVQVHLLYPQ